MDDFSQRPASPTVRLTVWLIVGLIGVAVSGSYIAKTEIVARGQGRVIPSGRVRVVQPQSDGKIAAILVKEGQAVGQGQALVAMDDTAARSDIKRIASHIAGQKQDAEAARSILKPLGTTDPMDNDFVKVGQAALPHAVSDDTEALVVAALSALRDRIAESDAQLLRLERQKNTQTARIEKARAEADIISQRFSSAAKLQQQGAISQGAYLERVQLQNAARNEAVIAEHELSALAAEAQVVVRQRKSTISAALSQHRERLNAAELTLQGLKAELTAAENKLSDLLIVAPVAGRVENLSVFTIGGFVEAGATMMSIVPAGDEIEVEAFFDNRDVGFLQQGQRAFVKFDAFPAERFGIVRGTLTSVGADARELSPARWVFAVRVRLDEKSIQVGGGRPAAFVPGMTATVDVITGERRLISYFFEPVLKAVQNSFGER